MSFWGPSDAMKEASGNLRATGAWDADQMKQWIGKQNEYYNQGNNLNNWSKDYNMDRVNAGFGSPEDLTALGKRIMPGVGDAIDRQWGRLNEQMGNYDNVPQGADTAAKVGSNLDTLGGMISGNQSNLQSEINDTYGRTTGRADAAHKDVGDNIRDNFGSLATNANTAYGGMRGTNETAYNDLTGSAGGAYGSARARTEMLKPGSSYQEAQVGRSYAPLISNTYDRVRRAGIDPNSAQASGMILGAERERARGMDDAAARGTGAYVNAANQLDIGEQQNKQGLRQNQLANELGLSENQLKTGTSLGLQQGQAFRDEQLRNTNAANAMDQARSNLSMQNQDTGFSRNANLIGQRNDQALLDRNLSMQDWQNRGNILNQMNAQENNALGMQDNVYQRGQQLQANNLAERNAAAANLQGMGSEATNNAFRSGQQSLGFGNAAQNAYNQVYQQEAPNAGWGAKMIGSVVNAFAPGMGDAITSAAGVNGGGQGYGGAGGAYGGGQGQYGGGYGGGGVFSALGNANPYNVQGGLNWGNQAAYPTGGYYDPNKTKTLANGDLQVGRY